MDIGSLMLMQRGRTPTNGQSRILVILPSRCSSPQITQPVSSPPFQIHNSHFAFFFRVPNGAVLHPQRTLFAAMAATVPQATATSMPMATATAVPISSATLTMPQAKAIAVATPTPFQCMENMPPNVNAPCDRCCKTKSLKEVKVWAGLFFIAGILTACGAVATAACLYPLALVDHYEIDGLDVAVDFPAGPQVYLMGVWHASKVSREGCGQYCEADTCSDFWLTEFAWSGAEVTSGPFSVLGSQLTSRFSQISTFEEMPGRVSRAAYGYTSNAVSQAWQSRRCYSNCDGARCGGASSLHFDGVPHCSEASTADWIGAHTSCAANTTSTLVTMAFQEQELTPGVTSWTSGVPPSAEGVNRFYK